VFLNKVIKNWMMGNAGGRGKGGQPALDVSIVDSSCNQLCRSV